MRTGVLKPSAGSHAYIPMRAAMADARAVRWLDGSGEWLYYHGSQLIDDLIAEANREWRKSPSA